VDAGVARPAAPVAMPARVGAPAPATPRSAAPVQPQPAQTAQLSRRGSGELEIFVQPWAEITLDGKNVGQTPFRRKLPVGQYQLRLENEDSRKSENMVISVTADRTTTIRRTW
jgi:hypothetical protein